MSLLDLAEEMGLKPKRTSLTHGGEYHSSCPGCGQGNDRFMFWPEKDRYWCRKCNAKGDAIQFCRDFLRLSFKEACLKMGQEEKKGRFTPIHREKRREVKIKTPSCRWQEKALAFVEAAHQRLLIDNTTMALVQQRGFSLDTIKKNRLGWNPSKTFYPSQEWGLEEGRSIYMPIGIVIPIFDRGILQKVKIRKKDEDGYGKYYEVPDSANLLPLFGDPSLQISVVVEAEFDAMLIIQEAGDLCNCIALGGAQKKPQEDLRDWLLTRKLILFALDFDDAGKNEYASWTSIYSNLEPWPVPEGKSPGDAYQKGISLKMWLENGLQHYL